MLKQSELRAFCMLQSLACKGPKVPEIYILASLFATVGPLSTCIDSTSSYRYSMILWIIQLWLTWEEGDKWGEGRGGWISSLEILEVVSVPLVDRLNQLVLFAFDKQHLC